MKVSVFFRFPVLLVLLALGARLAVIAWKPPVLAETFSPLNDCTDYDYLAQRILEGRYTAPGGQPTAFRPPGYPAFVASVYAVGGVRNVMAVVLTQAILGALSAWVAWRLAYRIFASRAASILTGCAVAFYPPFLLQTSQMLSEELSRFLLLGMLLFLWDGLDKRRPGRLAAGGIFLGALILTKSVAAAAAPFLGVLIAWRWAGNLRARAAALAGFLLPAAMMVGLWTLRNAAVRGGEIIPVSTNFPITFAQGVTRFSYYSNRWYGRERLMAVSDHFLELTQMRSYEGIHEELMIGRDYQARAMAFLRERPGWFARMTFRKALHFWNPWVRNARLIQWAGLLTMGPVLALGWIALIAGLWLGGAPRIFSLLALALAIPITLPYALSQPDVRYRTALLDPVWIPLAMWMATLICEKFLRWGNPSNDPQPPAPANR